MDYDKDKVDDYTLALMYLVSRVEKHVFGETARAWKGFDWDTLNRLHEKGLIDNPVGKAKSVSFSEEGYEKSREFFHRFFEKQP